MCRMQQAGVRDISVSVICVIGSRTLFQKGQGQSHQPILYLCKWGEITALTKKHIVQAANTKFDKLKTDDNTWFSAKKK